MKVLKNAITKVNLNRGYCPYRTIFLSFSFWGEEAGGVFGEVFQRDSSGDSRVFRRGSPILFSGKNLGGGNGEDTDLPIEEVGGLAGLQLA